MTIKSFLLSKVESNYYEVKPIFYHKSMHRIIPHTCFVFLYKYCIRYRLVFDKVPQIAILGRYMSDQYLTQNRKNRK